MAARSVHCLPYKRPVVSLSESTRTEITEVLGYIKVFTYEDLDSDGEQDDGKPLLSGWTFSINGDEYATDDSGSVITDALKPGDYIVTETQQSGWICTDPGSNLTKEVTVTNELPSTVYFGNHQQEVTEKPGSLTIYKYNDKNDDGKKKGHDRGLLQKQLPFNYYHIFPHLV